jgi:hypothetical protein
MQRRMAKLLVAALAATLVFGGGQAALAKAKHSHHAVRHRARTLPGEAAFWSGLVPVENGVSVIMRGFHPPSVAPSTEPRMRSERPVCIPRGSSSFVDIPPVNPAPYGPNSPPAAVLTQPPVQRYVPPPITTFSDRVNDAIHAYPLQKGIGNNPTDQQMFIRQRINQ